MCFLCFQEITNWKQNRNKTLQKKFTLNKACKEAPLNTELNHNTIPDFLWADRKHSILYCAIPKVASTFWRRIISILSVDKNINSPFEITQKMLTLEAFSDLKRDMTDQTMDNFLKNVTSFMFVRDPYGRLFSGYEHKLYNPNLSFWKSYGMKIVRSLRTNPSNMSLRFGHDVTFAEFVKYVLLQKDNNQVINRHFTPMHQKCDPCKFPYDYIGHLETFKDDTEYLFNKWRRKFPDFNIHFNNFEKETVLDTAGSLIRRLFNTYNKIKSEFEYPLYNLVLRVWSDLQIRGYLSKDISLPFERQDMETITAESMLKAVSDALKIQVNHTAVKLQRQESLQQAYSTVSPEDMERLHEYVLKDCQLFGYDDRPKLLYETGELLESKHIYLAGI
jgi:hypothetical protein